MAVVATSEIATREVEVAVIACVALFYEEGVKDLRVRVRVRVRVTVPSKRDVKIYN